MSGFVCNSIPITGTGVADSGMMKPILGKLMGFRLSAGMRRFCFLVIACLLAVICEEATTLDALAAAPVGRIPWCL